MIDTHAHLRTGEEQRINGLECVVLSASNLMDSVENIRLAGTNEKLLPAVGVHPQDIPKDIDQTVTSLDELLKVHGEIVAVGECGLDFSREFDLTSQEKMFRGQISLSQKYNKPLIIHSRKAMDETIGVLTSYQNLRGVIHCYSGGKKRIDKILNMNGDWYFGIDGNLTYEPGLQEVLMCIPKERLVLETDSPELTPVPYRGETNHPENVKYVYEMVSKLWGQTLEETESQIDRNARLLFQIV